LGLCTDGITVQHLEAILPDQFGGKFQDNKISARLKIEAFYQTYVHNQKEDIDRVEFDQSLHIPTDINYTQ